MANDGFCPSFDAPPRLERTALAVHRLCRASAAGLCRASTPFVPPPAGTALAASPKPRRAICCARSSISRSSPSILLRRVQRRGLRRHARRAVAAGAAAGLVPVPARSGRRSRASRCAAPGWKSSWCLSVLLSVDTIGPERAFRYWRIVLAVILLVNWISIPLIATARHLPGEIDPGLVGDWRGLYGHKNIAGAVCAMTAMLFLFTRNGRPTGSAGWSRRRRLGFLVMTRSKTSLGFLPLALAGGPALSRLAGATVSAAPSLPCCRAAVAGGWRRFGVPGCRRHRRICWKTPPNSPAAPRSGRPSSPISAIIPSGRRLRHLRRHRRPVAAAQLCPAAAGSRPSATAITAICNCWSPSAASALCWRMLALVVSRWPRFWALDWQQRRLQAAAVRPVRLSGAAQFDGIGFPGRRRGVWVVSAGAGGTRRTLRNR